MDALPRRNAAMRLYHEELSSRVVAQSGIPSDRRHVGKLIRQSLTDDPNFILQIDASNGVKETGGSVLRRSTECAVAMKNFGIKCGDVISLNIPNHSDACVVMYAAFYLGAAVAPIDAYMGVGETQAVLEIQKPKMIFCMNNNFKNVQEATSNAKLSPKLVTLDKNVDSMDLESFLQKFGDDKKVVEFKPTDFNSAETALLLMMTSGTTGFTKCAEITHSNFVHGYMEIWVRQNKFPDPERIALILSPLQWLSADLHYILAPILRYTMVQSPLRLDRDYIYDMINKFRPTHMICSPTLMVNLMNKDTVHRCDFSSFNYIAMGGSFMSPTVYDAAKKTMPKADIQVLYGQTESSGMGTLVDDNPVGSVGRVNDIMQYRLIDPETQEDIVEPNKTGELWLKGPSIFKGYYNDPERTQEVLREDGWFKTGDLFYIDENKYLYFVDRLKMLLKYNGHHVSPVELESLILKHPSVFDVAVTGIVDLESGDLPVACVVKRPGHNVTAQEIKDLVKNSLSDPKQLRGGVIFMDHLPLTVSSKVDRAKLKKMVTQLKRE